MKRVLVLCICLLITPVFTILGEGDCPGLVQQAMDSTSSVCNTTGRNQACYGYLTLTAQPQANVPAFTFANPGDKVAVDSIESMRLSPMELDKGIWGIALMRLQASLPASETSNITVLTFGDVQLDNAVQSETPLDITTTDYANVRSFPNTTAPVITSLTPDQTISAVQRLADNSWLRVDLPDTNRPGWVSASLIKSAGDLNTLPVGDSQKPAFRPMQAFYFQSGSGQPGCAEVPPSGLIIQTLEGSAEVRLWINEVRIDFGSTVFFQAQPNGLMTVTAVEGHARVEAMGVAQTAYAGSTLTVPLGADLKPTAPPSVPVAYDADALKSLPITLLQRPITIHAPLNKAELVSTQQQTVNGTGSTPGDGGNGGNNTCPTNNCNDECSGNNCNSTGNSAPTCSGDSCNSTDTGGDNTCPGNSCHDQCPGNSCNSNGNHKGKGNGEW